MSYFLLLTLSRAPAHLRFVILATYIALHKTIPGPTRGEWPLRQERRIMSEHRKPAGTIRKLWPAESGKFRDHLLRLDKSSRRMRFAHSVSDAFIADYATSVMDSTVRCAS